MSENNELNPTETGESQVLRDKGGKFVKGNSGNPGGGPKGRRTALAEIEQAIEGYEQREGVGYWNAATILAMTLAEKGNATLLGKLMDKFLPSKLEAEMNSRPIVMMNDITRIMPDGSKAPLRYNIGTKDETQLNAL